MGSLDADRPSIFEIQKQVELILASETFARSPALSRLLHFTVNSELHGRQINEGIIAREVFGREPDEDEHFVRVNLKNLRRALANYYRDSFDLVLIRGLEGRGYKPSFSYNHRSETRKKYFAGKALFERSFWMDLYNRDYFLKGLREAADKGHAAALAQMGLCMIALTLTERSGNAIKKAEEFAQNALALDPKLWLSHLVIGGVALCRRKWDEAGASFDTACRIGGTLAQEHPLHLLFLLAMGEERLALSIAGSICDTDMNSPAGEVLEGLSYLSIGKLADSMVCAGRALYINERFWPADVLDAIVWRDMSLYSLGWKKGPEPLEILRLEGSFSLFPGLELLLRTYYGFDEITKTLFETMLTVYEESESCGGCSQERTVEIGPGIRRKIKYVSHWEMALAYLAFGDSEECIRLLGRAIDDFSPLALWLHKWPYLYRLRDEDKFKRLVTKMDAEL